MNHCSFKWPHSSRICQSISLSFLYDTTTSATELRSKSEAEWQKPCDLDLLKADPSSEGWSSSKWNRHPRTSELPSPWLLVHPYYLKAVASPSQDRNFLGTLTTLIILCPLCHLGHYTLDSWTSGHTHTHTHTDACTHTCAGSRSLCSPWGFLQSASFWCPLPTKSVWQKIPYDTTPGNELFCEEEPHLQGKPEAR